MISKNKDINLIVAIVNRGYSDYVVEASKEAGAKGATIISGRGTGTSANETDTFLGINVQPEREIVLILCLSKNKNKIMTELCKRSSFNQEGKGICFSLPVNNAVGVSNLFNLPAEETDNKE